MLSERTQMIDDCEKREGQLTDWERSFVASVAERLMTGRGLSGKQDETLTRIWDRVTSRR